MEICDLLKQTRIDLGLSQQGMAGEVMSVDQYSRIESGEQRIKAEDLLELLESQYLLYAALACVAFYGQKNKPLIGI